MDLSEQPASVPNIPTAIGDTAMPDTSAPVSAASVPARTGKRSTGDVCVRVPAVVDEDGNPDTSFLELIQALLGAVTTLKQEAENQRVINFGLRAQMGNLQSAYDKILAASNETRGICMYNMLVVKQIDEAVKAAIAQAQGEDEAEKWTEHLVKSVPPLVNRDQLVSGGAAAGGAAAVSLANQAKRAKREQQRLMRGPAGHAWLPTAAECADFAGMSRDALPDAVPTVAVSLALNRTEPLAIQGDKTTE